MIWIICAVIAVLALALSVSVFFTRRNGSLDMLYILLGLFVATFCVYFPVFFLSYGLLSGSIGNLIHVLRVITIDADFLEFYETIQAGCANRVLFTLYVLLMGVVHVLMPAVSAVSAVTVLFRCFSSVQLIFATGRKKPMFVFSEMNERSLLLAKSLKGIKCDIVFAGSEKDAISTEAIDGLRVIFQDESVSELKLRSRRNKEVHLFCISENEDTSLTHCLQLIEQLTKLPVSEQSHFHIYHFTKEEDFSAYIDSADKGALDVQCVNEYEMLIYKLLDQYPLYRHSSNRIHVLLWGLQPINAIALRAIAWCGQLTGFETRISVVGSHIGAARERLLEKAPGLFDPRYRISFYDCGSEEECMQTIREKCRDASYVIVAEDGDNRTMERGIALRRLFYMLDERFENCPPVFCYIREPVKTQIVSKLATAESNAKRKMSYDLIPFGSLADVYTYEKLVNSDLEKLAKNVHLTYEEIFSDGPIDVEDAIRRYNIFEVNKRSNRANALHIRYKLNLLGLDYTDAPNAEPVQMQDYYTDERMEQLARAEHDRWMAFLESEGWLSSNKEQVNAYRASNISRGRHNCPVLKMHPYICPYEDLKELSEDLEGKDTTVYDRELILRIPAILGDKWGKAGKKFTIIKLDK